MAALSTRAVRLWRSTVTTSILKPTSVPDKSGAWFLTREVRAPKGPDEAISNLLALFPETAEFWQQIIEKYDVSIRVAIHTSGWNRGFDLPADLLRRIGRIGVRIDFDLYFYADDNEDG